MQNILICTSVNEDVAGIVFFFFNRSIWAASSSNIICHCYRSNPVALLCWNDGNCLMHFNKEVSVHWGIA